MEVGNHRKYLIRTFFKNYLELNRTEAEDGLFQRNKLRRRPGTVAVAAAIQNKYNITCRGFCSP